MWFSGQAHIYNLLKSSVFPIYCRGYTQTADHSWSIHPPARTSPNKPNTIIQYKTYTNKAHHSALWALYPLRPYYNRIGQTHTAISKYATLAAPHRDIDMVCSFGKYCDKNIIHITNRRTYNIEYQAYKRWIRNLYRNTSICAWVLRWKWKMHFVRAV